MNPPRDAPKAPIDWDEVHRQLERNAAAVGEALRPSPERVQAVLDERTARWPECPRSPRAPRRWSRLPPSSSPASCTPSSRATSDGW